MKPDLFRQSSLAKDICGVTMPVAPQDDCPAPCLSFQSLLMQWKNRRSHVASEVREQAENELTVVTIAEALDKTETHLVFYIGRVSELLVQLGQAVNTL